MGDGVDATYSFSYRPTKGQKNAGRERLGFDFVIFFTHKFLFLPFYLLPFFLFFFLALCLNPWKTDRPREVKSRH
jgi:hypothetical protein